MMCNSAERPQIMPVGFDCLEVTGNLNSQSSSSKKLGVVMVQKPGVEWVPNGGIACINTSFKGGCESGTEIG